MVLQKGQLFKTIIGYLLLSALLSVAVFGEPLGPTTLNEVNDTRRSTSAISSGAAVNAQAGNVSELILDGVAVTEAWQGYYGNITGDVVLDNGNNQSFYRWDLTIPSGEVYASNNSLVNWSSVQCVNFTNGSNTINASYLDLGFGIDSGQADNFSNTFSQLYTGTFLIGTRPITTGSQCHMTNLYNGSSIGHSDWTEVLLTDNSSRSVIFASILTSNKNAFDNSSRDFQMIVAENGNNSDTTPTPYYFFVELS